MNDFSIRTIRQGDIATVNDLSSQAGWNQTRSDWGRFLDLEPNGCFAGVLAGQCVATSAAFVFGEVGWIALVLVKQEQRGHGMGTALVKRALSYLQERGVKTARLDATPMGSPIYEKLGFRVEYSLSRFEGLARRCSKPRGDVRVLRPDELVALLELDAEITATSRPALLRRLIAEQPDSTFVYDSGAGPSGYVTSRSGRSAVQIGPGIARDSQVIGPLLDHISSHFNNQQIFLDIPDSNDVPRAWAKSMGLTVQRSLMRMCRGPTVSDNPAGIFASSGPEKG